MKQVFYIFSTLFGLTFVVGCSKDSISTVSPNTDLQFAGKPVLDTAVPIFQTASLSTYRKTMASIINDDGSVDAWFTTPGNKHANGVAYSSMITYKRSADGGKTWSDESVAVRPRQANTDQLFTSDPSVVKLSDGYYYMAYTTSQVSTANDNVICMCRAQNAAGPWSKWDGTKWGGDTIIPVVKDLPIVAKKYYGSGYVSLIVSNNTLQLYYTSIPNLNQYFIKLSTTDISKANWPNNFTKGQIVFDNSSKYGTMVDRMTIKYRTDINKYMGLLVALPTSDTSYINYFQSDDGNKFTNIGALRFNLKPNIYGCGISSDASGNIKTTNKNFLSYTTGSATNADTYINYFSFK